MSETNEPSYVELIQRIERHGIESIDAGLFQQLTDVLTEERKLRSVNNSERQRALLAERRRREEETNRKRENAERKAEQERKQGQSDREEKMRDWFVKLVARDRNRAADKRALKELIENKAAKNSPLRKPGMACTSSTLSQPVTSSVSRDLSCSQQSTDSPVPTTRSNMEVYKFVSFLRRQISRVSSGNYITHMGESNYAKSTQKASNVYGQKSSHKRRQERYYMHE